jgi:hypothetical protein
MPSQPNYTAADRRLEHCIDHVHSYCGIRASGSRSTNRDGTYKLAAQ